MYYNYSLIYLLSKPISYPSNCSVFSRVVRPKQSGITGNVSFFFLSFNLKRRVRRPPTVILGEGWGVLRLPVERLRASGGSNNLGTFFSVGNLIVFDHFLFSHSYLHVIKALWSVLFTYVSSLFTSVSSLFTSVSSLFTSVSSLPFCLVQLLISTQKFVPYMASCLLILQCRLNLRTCNISNDIQKESSPSSQSIFHPFLTFLCRIRYLGPFLVTGIYCLMLLVYVLSDLFNWNWEDWFWWIGLLDDVKWNSPEL